MLATALLKTMDARIYFVYFSRIGGPASQMVIPEHKYPEPCARILVCARQILRVNHWRFANLSAPFWRLYWNAGPGACIQTQGAEVRLSPAHVYVLPPNTPYATRNPRAVDHFYLHFLTRAPYTAVAPGLYSFPLRQTAARAIDALSRILRQSPDNADGICEAMAAPAYLLAYLALNAVPAGKFHADRADPRITRSITEMEAHLHQDTHNDRLAARAGMNTNAFIRLFKNQTGVTPQGYLRRKRVEKACLLLRFTDKTIETIAAETGFCDRYHLTRVFHRLRGLGPAAFRKIRA